MSELGVHINQCKQRIWGVLFSLSQLIPNFVDLREHAPSPEGEGWAEGNLGN